MQNIYNIKKQTFNTQHVWRNTNNRIISYSMKKTHNEFYHKIIKIERFNDKGFI